MVGEIIGNEVQVGGVKKLPKVFAVICRRVQVGEFKIAKDNEIGVAGEELKQNILELLEKVDFCR